MCDGCPYTVRTGARGGENQVAWGKMGWVGGRVKGVGMVVRVRA